MKAKRVDCSNCENFKFPEYYSLYPELLKSKEKCKLGKRVMFRINGTHPESSNWECGWFRYCEDFKTVIKQRLWKKSI